MNDELKPQFPPDTLALFLMMTTVAMEVKVLRTAICQTLESLRGTIGGKPVREWIQVETQKQIEEYLRQLAAVEPAHADQLMRMFELWKTNNTPGPN